MTQCNPTSASVPDLKGSSCTEVALVEKRDKEKQTEFY